MHSDKYLNSSERGFTLIEAIVIILILSILASTAFIRLGKTTDINTYTFTQTLTQDLRLTKALSMSQNSRYRLVLGATSYQILDENSQPYTHPEYGSAAISYPTNITISPQTTLVFNSLGQPYDISNNPFSSNLTLTIQSASQSKTLTIYQQTGFIE